MALNKLDYNGLMERLGVVLEQTTIIKRGLKEHTDNDLFNKAAIFFREEAENILAELLKRRKAGQ